MKKSCLLGTVRTNLLAGMFFTVVLIPSALAAPVGLSYEVLFDVSVSPSGLETHSGFITFDGLAEVVTLDGTYGDGLLPGYDLMVTESLTSNANGTERVSIVFAGPTSGATLTANPINPNGFIELDVNGLHWGDQAVVPSNFQLDVVYVGGGTGAFDLTLSDWDVFGNGTAASPLEIGPLLDSAMLTDTVFGDAIEATFSFDVAYVPLPAAVWLFGSGLLGLVGIARRKKAA